MESRRREISFKHAGVKAGVQESQKPGRDSCPFFFDFEGKIRTYRFSFLWVEEIRTAA
jgi:hypothetical protein